MRSSIEIDYSSAVVVVVVDVSPQRVNGDFKTKLHAPLVEQKAEKT